MGAAEWNNSQTLIPLGIYWVPRWVACHDWDVWRQRLFWHLTDVIVKATKDIFSIKISVICCSRRSNRARLLSNAYNVSGTNRQGYWRRYVAKQRPCNTINRNRWLKWIWSRNSQVAISKLSTSTGVSWEERKLRWLFRVPLVPQFHALVSVHSKWELLRIAVSFVGTTYMRLSLHT